MRFKLAIILILFIPGIMKSQNATATIANAISCSGESTLVAVNVTNFTDVAAMTLYIGYDTNTADFISLQNINPAITGSPTVNATNGQVGIAYSSVNPFTITSGKLFDLQFTFLGDSTSLPFNPGTEIANSNLEVIPLTTYAGSISTGFVIVDQPDSVQAYPDNDVIFTVAASGTPDFQWQENSGNGWANLQNNQIYSGVDQDTLYIYDVSLSYNNFTYRCILTSGGCEDTTQTALLEVADAFPSCTLGTLQSCPEQSILEPLMAGDFFDVVEFTFVISFDDNDLEFTGLENIDPLLSAGTLTYNTTSNPSGVIIQWNDDIPFSISSGKLFDLEFNYFGNDNALVFEEGTEVLNAQSNPVNVTLTNGQVSQFEVPVITLQPQNITVTEGDDALFKVTATGANGYQWQVSQDGGNSWTNLSNGAPYFNVTTSQLTIDPASLGMDNYQYSCVVNSDHCNVVSTSAVLSVDSLTSIHEFERNNRILSVQPNPFCQYLDITSEDELSGVTINIYNPNGNLVLCQKVKTISQTYKLNLPELMKGMYLIEVSGVSGDKLFTETRKIIKSN